MQDFFCDCDEPITVERALTYLVLWHYKGIAYRGVPTNGVIRSPGFKSGLDKDNFGSLGDIETWFIRPTQRQGCLNDQISSTEEVGLERLL